MNKEDTIINLAAGGVAGTTAAIITCPLEVVKTRLQASNSNSSNHPGSSSKTSSSSSSKLIVEKSPRTVPKLDSSFVAQIRCRHSRNLPRFSVPFIPQTNLAREFAETFRLAFRHLSTGGFEKEPKILLNNGHDVRRLSLYRHFVHIIKTEGMLGLWRGVGPTLVGVAPSRAIYFCAYSNAKAYFNQTFVPDTPIVHFCSAFCAGFFQTTCTNPIWMIRTRMQLDRMTGNNKLTLPKCVKKVYHENGIKGFYRGVTASYYGISETVIYFVIYERLKMIMVGEGEHGERKMHHFLQLMLCAAASRMVASSVCYPHEVARTRLREEGNKYRKFWQTLAVVVREESWRGLYNGIGANLIRTIPNTAITMGTYELAVHLLKQFKSTQS